MSPAEARAMVADLTDDSPCIMPDGRMRSLQGPQWRPAGVHRRGLTLSGVSFGPGRAEIAAHAVHADVSWYETVTEWFERSAA